MTAQIFITCLAAYNAGTLHGEWIQCTDEETIQAGIKRVLESSPENNNPYPCEEFFITDHEGLGDIEEYTPVSEIMERVEFINEVEEESLAVAILEHVNDINEAKKMFENYIGEYKNQVDYAYGLMEDCYNLKDIPDLIRYHIDWEGVGRGLFIDGHIDISSPNGIYVFNQY